MISRPMSTNITSHAYPIRLSLVYRTDDSTCWGFDTVAITHVDCVESIFLERCGDDNEDHHKPTCFLIYSQNDDVHEVFCNNHTSLISALAWIQELSSKVSFKLILSINALTLDDPPKACIHSDLESHQALVVNWDNGIYWPRDCTNTVCFRSNLHDSSELINVLLSK